MSELSQDNVRCCPDSAQKTFAIHTKKITDSCRDKDCIEDLRVYLTTASQNLLDCAAGARVRCADLLYAYVDVDGESLSLKPTSAITGNRVCAGYYRIHVLLP